VYRRFRTATPRHPLQEMKTVGGYPLKRLGTDYGGWTFVDDANLYGSTIVSAGLGEDASFDVEFARQYDAKVIIVDPTPRAIAHFNALMAEIGNGKRRNYVSGGKQPVAAYDLRGLSPANFTLVSKALWNTRGTLKFFEPANSTHVSYSIVNYQQDYGQDSKYLEVESITVAELLELTGLDRGLKLLKLDIEGAEVEVISELLDGHLRPNQILVEFDELNVPSRKAFDRIDFVDSKLKAHGYKCIYTDGQADFLYVRSADEGAPSQ